MNKHITKLLLAAAALGFTCAAQAVATFRISDGVSTITVAENTALDASGTVGRIVWDGTIGVWNLNTDVGTSFPVIGTLAAPKLDLSFNANSTAAGTLTIEFSVDGFGPTLLSAASASIGGTSEGAGKTVSYSTFGGTNNTLFSSVNLLTSQGPFFGAFSGSVVGGAVNNAGPYALTQRIVITHNGASITTGNAFVTTVPDSGSTLVLLGAGLAVLGLISRRQK